MTPQDIINHFGGPEKQVAVAARELEVVPMTIYTWLRDGRVPYKTQCAIQIRTRGKLKAEAQQ